MVSASAICELRPGRGVLATWKLVIINHAKKVFVINHSFNFVVRCCGRSSASSSPKWPSSTAKSFYEVYNSTKASQKTQNFDCFTNLNIYFHFRCCVRSSASSNPKWPSSTAKPSTKCTAAKRSSCLAVSLSPSTMALLGCG